MRETLLTLREVSGQIDRGSEQLAYAAEDLAEGSTDQAGQVSNLVNVFQQMTDSMERIWKRHMNRSGLQTGQVPRLQ